MTWNEATQNLHLVQKGLTFISSSGADPGGAWGAHAPPSRLSTRETQRFTARLAHVEAHISICVMASCPASMWRAQICSSQETVASNTKADSEGKGL